MWVVNVLSCKKLRLLKLLFVRKTGNTIVTGLLDNSISGFHPSVLFSLKVLDVLIILFITYSLGVYRLRVAASGARLFLVVLTW